MRKIVVVFVGLLLLVTYGCSSEEAKETAEKSKDAVIEGTEKTAKMGSEAATATKEAATKVKAKAVEMGDDAVKAVKKKPAIEGC